ncbi:hypothetical protein LTR66_009213, partial [Elasticomyces elasticus]
NIVINDLAEDAKLDAGRIATAVGAKTSILYGDIVEFCLSVLQDETKLRLPNLDREYDISVLKPAKELSTLAATN